MAYSTADQHLRSLLLADVDIGEDLLELIIGRLRTHHRAVVQGVALLYLANAGDGFLHEAVINLCVYQCAARGGDLALIKGEHGEALQRLVKKVIILVGDIGEEDVR